MWWVATAMAALVVAGCGTSRVGDELTAATLAQKKKGVALMLVSAAHVRCSTVSIDLGVRDKAGFRKVGGARIVRSATDAPVAEIELDPGEYHVIGYACFRGGQRNEGGGILSLDNPPEGGLFKRSYASFTVEPGEVVNVGFLRVEYRSETRGIFQDTLHANLSVIDWPLKEIERYRQQRPQLYAQFRTRFMTVRNE